MPLFGAVLREVLPQAFHGRFPHRGGHLFQDAPIEVINGIMQEPADIMPVPLLVSVAARHYKPTSTGGSSNADFAPSSHFWPR